MKKLSFLFTGDVMAHDNQLCAARDDITGEYDFSGNFRHILKYIQSADISICNLETTIADGEPTGFPRFNTPAAIADAISNAGFSCVATANNHAFDSGISGIISTRETLESRSLNVIGTRKFADEKAYVVMDVHGVKVGLLNFTYETAAKEGTRTLNNRPMDSDATALLNSFSFESIEDDLVKIETEIAAARQDGAQILIIYYHWGNEYERYSNVFQKYVAWRTAHMGVDAIIGSHAHVAQELGEIVVTDGSKEKRVPVFYGLGNYIWGGKPFYERETVLNNILALLDIDYDEETGSVLVTPSWVPLYIGQKDNMFETIDVQSLDPAEYAAFEEHFGIHPETVLAQLQKTVTNQIHTAKVQLYFDRILSLQVGERISVLNDFLPGKEYVKFQSEDALVASVTKNGYLIGNSVGYVGLTAIERDGTETAFLAHVLPGESSRFPILINENNRIRDIYVPRDLVKGEKYQLKEGLRLCRPAAKAWYAMQTAAAKEGIYITAVHALRYKIDQIKRRKQYAKIYGNAAAAKRYQRFGCTEHHLGTALDVKPDIRDGITTTKEDAFRWIQQNCSRYGFVLRRFTTKLGNVAYFHLRYIDNPALVHFLNESGLTLEQYLSNYEQYCRK